jgi:hypothetical protein
VQVSTEEATVQVLQLSFWPVIPVAAAVQLIHEPESITYPSLQAVQVSTEEAIVQVLHPAL